MHGCTETYQPLGKDFLNEPRGEPFITWGAYSRKSPATSKGLPGNICPECH